MMGSAKEWSASPRENVKAITPGSKRALLDLKEKIAKDQQDVQHLRQIIAAAEYNLRRQQRLASAKD
ncbi:hypothetical protein N7517_009492 [Penicillium concentricum]|uniref:Uncharacterized protein n=1 Tax=Penicillium concentricum TaxID=293559 RepID=A0A9W9RHN7_9EURO|nr:uncharacterized protein N7517_009492 [Penicillium concentricum]KAJ5360301.1 hypothetical protein N7517_009492 [Penicillium concentricum]